MNPMTEADKIIKSKVKGQKWVEMALPMICEVAREKKDIEGKLAEEVAPLKARIKEIGTRYAGSLEVLDTIDEVLRKRAKVEYMGPESVSVPGEGEITYPERWSFSVSDVKKVPQILLTVDSVAVNKEIKAGVRKISGLVIETVRSMTVRAEKKE